MGRVARYKKIKSCDPYSKQNRSAQGGRGTTTTLWGERIWGMNDNGVKKKKRSRTAERLRAEKLQRREKRHRSKHQLSNSSKRSDGELKFKTNGDDDGFNLPPTEGDEFDMKDLATSKKGSNRHIKRQKTVEEQVEADFKKKNSEGSSSSMDGLTALAEMQQETKANRQILQLDAQFQRQAKDDKRSNMERAPEESRNAYRKRTHEETRNILMKEAVASRTSNPEKRQKKKDFLNNKKKNRKNSTRSVFDDDNSRSYGTDTRNNDDYNDGFVSGEQAIAMKASAAEASSSFSAAASSTSSTWTLLDQVERPPSFAQLPRGAAKKSKAISTASSSTKKSKSTQEEQKVMEQMRRRVQAQYAAMKQKRKGEAFHM